jgi:hypothetical protein
MHLKKLGKIIFSTTLAKVGKLVNSAHKSYKIRQRLESIEKLLSNRNQTRWLSDFNMVTSILKLSEQDAYTSSIKKNLLESLKKRLHYLIEDKIFAYAAILTPRFGKLWCTFSEGEKYDDEIIIDILEFIQKYPLKIKSNGQLQNNQEKNTSSNDKDLEQPPNKRLKVLDYLKLSGDTSTFDELIELKTKIKQQYSDYIVITGS